MNTKLKRATGAFAHAASAVKHKLARKPIDIEKQFEEAASYFSTLFTRLNNGEVIDDGIIMRHLKGDKEDLINAFNKCREIEFSTTAGSTLATLITAPLVILLCAQFLPQNMYSFHSFNLRDTIVISGASLMSLGAITSLSKECRNKKRIIQDAYNDFEEKIAAADPNKPAPLAVQAQPHR